MVAVSVGAGPALLAAADPRVRDRVRARAGLGGYASARELVRFYLTGDYGWDGARGGRAPRSRRSCAPFVAGQRRSARRRSRAKPWPAGRAADVLARSARCRRTC